MIYDTKYTPTRTEERHRVAAERIPHFCSQLQVGARTLDARSVELLFGEYRAYFRSNKPFRSEITRCSATSTHLFDDWSVDQLLEWLAVPEGKDKGEVLGALCSLRAEVTIEASRKNYALA